MKDEFHINYATLQRRIKNRTNSGVVTVTWPTLYA